MSKARRIEDAHRTAIMHDLVLRMYAEHYPLTDRTMSRRHVLLEEVAPSTGWAARRWADVLALSVWPSDGMGLEGYEIKASRADLKRELADPTKHQALAQYCDMWWLFVWDEKVIGDLMLELPEEWGVLVTEPEEYGHYKVKTLRRAKKLTPLPFPREFVCSLVRNAFEQSPAAGFVGRACVESQKKGFKDGLYVGKRDAHFDFEKLIRPLTQFFKQERDERGDTSWYNPSPEDAVAEAIARIAKDGAVA